MATETEVKGFVGGVFMLRGDGGSPEIFTKICSVFSISGLGTTNDLVDATTFCSLGTKEYIAGLADGAEVTLGCNFRADGSDEETTQRSMMDDVDNRAIRTYEMTADGDLDGIDNERFSFQALAVGWNLAPSTSAKNGVNFVLKISGRITRFYL